MEVVAVVSSPVGTGQQLPGCPGFQKPKRQSWAYDINDNLQDSSRIPNVVFMVKHNFFLKEDSPNGISFEALQNLRLAPHAGDRLLSQQGQ